MIKEIWRAVRKFSRISYCSFGKAVQMKRISTQLRGAVVLLLAHLLRLWSNTKEHAVCKTNIILSTLLIGCWGSVAVKSKQIGKGSCLPKSSKDRLFPSITASLITYVRRDTIFADVRRKKLRYVQCKKRNSKISVGNTKVHVLFLRKHF